MTSNYYITTFTVPQPTFTPGSNPILVTVPVSMAVGDSIQNIIVIAGSGTGATGQPINTYQDVTSLFNISIMEFSEITTDNSFSGPFITIIDSNNGYSLSGCTFLALVQRG